ncbi:MAG: hypothetical protein GY838_17125 [bacterium]|nr:hypothetical protein [bacterium]
MSSFGRFLWTVTLMAFLAGCSGYRAAALPRSDATDGDPAARITVTKGSDVKVHLLSGEVVKGEVEEVSQDRIVVGKPGNYGYEQWAVERREIENIEVLKAGRGTSILMYTGFGLALVYLAVGLVVTASLSNIAGD